MILRGIVSIVILVLLATQLVLAGGECNLGGGGLCKSSENSYYYSCDCGDHGCSLPGPPEFVCVVSHCTMESAFCWPPAPDYFKSECTHFSSIYTVNFCDCQGWICYFY